MLPKCPIVVVFGRAGAGKSTVSDAAVKVIQGRSSLHETAPSLATGGKLLVRILALDLDVCVPQWMRDNFAKGIYPTLKQREDFAEGACNFVDAQLFNFLSDKSAGEALRPACIISFSFVNVDLREVFRVRFPQAIWMLMDVNDSTAKIRIDQREGHFYKGAPAGEGSSSATGSSNSSLKEGTQEKRVGQSSQNNGDGSEWDFAPVTYPHIILDGVVDISTNAKIIVDEIESLVRPKHDE